MTCTAPPDAVWPLLAEPARWHEWAPHVRGAVGLGRPEVRVGAAGVVRLAGVVPVPARILEVRSAGERRRWSWRVGPMTMDHVLEALSADGSRARVTITLAAREPLESLLAAGYGPVIALMLRNLARVAAARRP